MSSNINNIKSNNKNNNKNNNKKQKKLSNSLNSIRTLSNNSSLNNSFEYESETPKIVENYQKIEKEGTSKKIDLPDSTLSQKFRDLTNTHLNNMEDSGLVLRRYNVKNNKIEVTNDKEYHLLREFILNGGELLTDDSINQSPMGRIILNGYQRFINSDNYCSYDLKEIIKNIRDKKDTWFQLCHKPDIHICFKDLEEQYLNNLDDRYQYLGCICIVNTDYMRRLPIYKDKNGDLGFPSMRNIVKFYFSMVNLGKNDIFLDFDKTNNALSLMIYNSKEIIRYQITEKGVCFHEEFAEYLNTEYLESLKEHENTHL